MSVYSSSRNPVGNNLIAALPQQEYERLLPKFEAVSLSIKQVLKGLGLFAQIGQPQVNGQLEHPH